MIRSLKFFKYFENLGSFKSGFSRFKIYRFQWFGNSWRNHGFEVTRSVSGPITTGRLWWSARNKDERLLNRRVRCLAKGGKPPDGSTRACQPRHSQRISRVVFHSIVSNCYLWYRCTDGFLNTSNSRLGTAYKHRTCSFLIAASTDKRVRQREREREERERDDEEEKRQAPGVYYTRERIIDRNESTWANSID